MAKAESVVRVETETYEEVVRRTREVKHKEVTLTMSAEEALTLLRVTHNVGGGGIRREHIDSIATAIRGEGIELPSQMYKNLPKHGDLRAKGSIYFVDPDGTYANETFQ